MEWFHSSSLQWGKMAYGTSWGRDTGQVIGDGGVEQGVMTAVSPMLGMGILRRVGFTVGRGVSVQLPDL